MKRTPTHLAEIADTTALREWEIRQGRGRQVAQDLPLTRWTLAAAAAAVAVSALAASVWPWGFA